MITQPVPAHRTVAARIVLGLILTLLFLMSGFQLQSAHAAGTAAAGTIATGARIGGDATRTRFVVDLTQAVGYTVYVLPDPYRVMIDMPSVRFDLAPDAGSNTRGLISEFRYGEVEEGRSRIVIDTNGPVLIEKSFIVEPQAGQPARIVVDLVQTSSEAFAAALKSDETTSMAAIADAAENGKPTPEIMEPAAADAGSAKAETATDDPEQAVAAIPVPRPKPGNEIAAPAEDTPAPPSRHAGKRLVVIDPGHGGIDPGAIGLKKTKEKDVVLAFGLKLRDI